MHFPSLVPQQGEATRGAGNGRPRGAKVVVENGRERSLSNGGHTAYQIVAKKKPAQGRPEKTGDGEHGYIKKMYYKKAPYNNFHKVQQQQAASNLLRIRVILNPQPSTHNPTP